MVSRYLYGHDSEQNSFIVSNYPWGFKTKTERKYWVETRPNYGQRICYMTKNPKSGKWCAIKKCSYSKIIVLGLNNDGHIISSSITEWGAGTIEKEKKLQSFYLTHKENLNEYQLNELKKLKAQNEVLNEVFKNVKWEIKPSEKVVLF